MKGAMSRSREGCQCGRQRKLLVRLNLVGSDTCSSPPVQGDLPQASLACLGLKICLVLSNTYRLGRRVTVVYFQLGQSRLSENGPALCSILAVLLSRSGLPTSRHCQIKA